MRSIEGERRRRRTEINKMKGRKRRRMQRLCKPEWGPPDDRPIAILGNIRQERRGGRRRRRKRR